MFTFYCDLDNTLIYSYKHSIGEDKKCVEIYQGREISFMTKKSCELLEQITKKVLLIPTTTRTMEQYNRINLGINEPNFALVCNGGVLLKNGKKDEEWYQDSLKQIADCEYELKKAEKMLANDRNRSFELINIENLFWYTKSSKPFETVYNLQQELNVNLVDVCSNGLKVYVIPKKLSKGAAIRRLKKEHNLHSVIAAGDSIFDISMFEEAKIGMAPQKLKETFHLKETIKIFTGTQPFSEQILEYIEEMLSK